jgi:catechol 2,3-dioxygenase-like lactoylglutathione lyase family enzyme
MNEKLLGIHHVTAIAGDPQRNLDFYVGVLGLRLVKKTVNFDDPTTHHFYYGDETGQPGTILTFFPWPGAPRGQRGAGQITVTSFSVPEHSLNYWIDRFNSSGVRFEGPATRFEEEVLTFYDPDGLKLELVAHTGELRSNPWRDSPVKEEHAVRGIHGVTLSEPGHEPTSRLLAETLNFPFLQQEGERFRFKAGEGATGGIVDILSLPGGVAGRIAVGTVHHVAWRTVNFEQQCM